MHPILDNPAFRVDFARLPEVTILAERRELIEHPLLLQDSYYV